MIPVPQPFSTGGNCDTHEAEGTMSGLPVGIGKEYVISFGMSCIAVELTASVV
jgi:hypothetical protein